MAKREKISPAPLTPDEAMRALLQVKPADVAKLEARERKKKGTKKKRGKWRGGRSETSRLRAAG